RYAVARFVVRFARQVLVFIEIYKTANKKIKPPVIVIVEPDRARRPSRGDNPSLFRNVRESAIPVVVIQDAPSILRDVEIRKAVSIVIASRNTLAVPASRDSGLFGNIGKGSVAIVSVQGIPQRWVRIKKVTLPAIHQINVHPPIAVVVEERTSGSRRLRQIFLRRLPIDMCPGDVTHRGRDLFERVDRRWHSVRKA